MMSWWLEPWCYLVLRRVYLVMRAVDEHRAMWRRSRGGTNTTINVVDNVML